MRALSRRSRKTRGEGLPSCGMGVTVPISAKPQPSRRMASGTRASLSKPAAIPTGFGNVKPANVTAERCVVCGRRGKHAQLQCFQGDLVRFLRRQQRQGARCKIEQHFQHAANSLGNIGTPSAPSGSANTAPALVVGNAEYRCGKRSPPRDTSQRSVSPRTRVSYWINSRSCLLRKCLASVPAICSRVDKWIYPSRTSSAEPMNAPRSTRVLPRRARHHLEHELSSRCHRLYRAASCASSFFVRDRDVCARDVAPLACCRARTRSELRSLRRSFSEIAAVAAMIVMLPSWNCRLPVLPRCREGQTQNNEC